LNTVVAAHLIDEIIIVTDGCTDSTADEARGFLARLERGEVKSAVRGVGGVKMRVFELDQNIGKGGAMTYGAHRTDAHVLLFLDADLIGLTAKQVDSLLVPMLHSDKKERADMTLGLFEGAHGGIVGWSLSFFHRRFKAITGQRAIRRDVFLAVPGLTRSRFGVETAITRYVLHAWKLKVQHVSLYGVSHPMKEEKVGLFRGFKHRSQMYIEMGAWMAYDTLRNSASAQARAQRLQMREYFSNRG
jgi:glycosyltransferase involved in cell wall biosynthesis